MKISTWLKVGALSTGFTLITGCMSTSGPLLGSPVASPNAVTTPMPSTLPGWVSTPPADTATSLYGIGVATDFNQARQQALRDISGKFGTVVAGYLKQRQQVANEQATQYVDRQLIAEIQATPLSHYQVIKSEAKGEQIYVLVEVARQAMQQELNSQLTQLNLRADQHRTDKQQDKLRWLLQGQALLNQQYPKAQRLADLLHSLSGQTTPSQQKLAAWEQLNTDLADTQQALCFTVLNQGNAHTLVAPVANALNEQGFSVGSRERLCDYRVELRASQQQQSLFSQYVTTLHIDIKLLSRNGQRIAGKREIVHANSVTGQQEADRAAVRVFSQQLSDHGLWQGLGMEIAPSQIKIK